MMFNKRGEVAVGVMVIVALLLFTFLLVQINVNASSVKDSFAIVYSYGDVYAAQESMENSLYFVLLESFLNNYKKVLDENSLDIGFSTVNLNDKFKEKMNSDLVVFSNYQGTNRFELFLKEKKPYITFDGESAKIVVDKWREEKVLRDGENIYFNTSYGSALSSEVLFKRLELPSFDNINKIYSDCTQKITEDLIEVCFKTNLQRFDIKFEYVVQRPTVSATSTFGYSQPAFNANSATESISGNLPSGSVLSPAANNLNSDNSKVYTIATLTSKDKYYINKQMQNVEFKLVFYYNSNALW